MSFSWTFTNSPVETTELDMVIHSASFSDLEQCLFLGLRKQLGDGLEARPPGAF